MESYLPAFTKKRGKLSALPQNVYTGWCSENKRTESERPPDHIVERACGADLIVRREIGGRDPLNPARQ